MGISCGSVVGYRLDSITARKLVLVMSNGIRKTWTRAPAD
jgi:hypothetical protein